MSTSAYPKTLPTRDRLALLNAKAELHQITLRLVELAFRTEPREMGDAP